MTGGVVLSWVNGEMWTWSGAERMEKMMLSGVEEIVLRGSCGR